MLLLNLDLLARDPSRFLVVVGLGLVALLLAITIHEFSHALLAHRLGDHTAHRLGRLTLNPLAHLDPVGTVLLLLVGFGWGRPVPVNAYALKGNPKTSMALVALAGPLSNFLLAAALALPLRNAYALPEYLEEVLFRVFFFNLLLGVFNLLPVAPLDGFKVALGLLPRQTAYSFARLEPYGPGILMIVIAAGYFIPGFNPLWDILSPVINLLSLLLLGQRIIL
ncbi:MAG: site-2 protease family protein [Chloroflexi bacterium]|nr:site-2 protease family protein [Chloroflexota bacterium]